MKINAFWVPACAAACSSNFARLNYTFKTNEKPMFWSKAFFAGGAEGSPRTTLGVPGGLRGRP